MRFVCDSCRAQYMISDEKVGPKGVKVRCKKCGYVILVKKTDANGHGAKAPQAPVPLSNDPDDALATQVMQNPLSSPGGAPALGDESAPGINEEKTSVLPQQGGGGGGMFDAGDDEIGAVFDQVLNSGAHWIPKGAKGEEKTETEQQTVGGEGGGEGGKNDRMSTRVIDTETVKKLAEESGGEGKNGNGHSGKDVPKTDWFVAIDDKQTGPLTLDTIKQHWERGEIGPDSLCWRAGFSDWIPVSEVADLAAELAPRPAKPVMVAPVTVGGGMPGGVMSVPVESAFSAGGVMKSVRSEVQVPLSAAAPEETGSWRPSAASALASLVKEEMEALAKPPPSAADPAGMSEPPVSSSAGGLLNDLPEASIGGAKKGVNGNGASARPALGDSPGEMTAMHGPKNPYIANPGATYSSPAVTQYRPSEGGNKTAIIAIVAFAGVAVLGIGAFVLVSLSNRQPVVQPVQNPPVQNPPVQNPQIPNTAQQNPPPNQINNNTPPPPNPNTQANNQTGNTNNAVAANSNTGPKTDGKTTEKTDKVKLTSPGQVGSSSKSGGEKKTTVASAETGEKPPKEEKGSKPVVTPKGDDDEFAAAFGGEKPKKESKTDKGSESGSDGPKKTVFVPPAPGQGGNIPETLSQSDVLEVVKSNVPSIKKCVEEQKAKEPGSKGRMSMKWQILTSGKVTKVECVSDEFKSSYLAGCIGGLIKSWQFPKHKTQGDPIVFPFTF